MKNWEQINYDDGQTCGDKCLLDILWLVLVLAETTEEEDVWVLRRRVGCKWSEVHRYRWDELKACGRSNSVIHRLHATSCHTACMGDKKADWYKKKDTNKTAINGWGPNDMAWRQDSQRLPLTFPSHHSPITDKRTCWKQEKATQSQKKNNLLSVTFSL